MSPLEILEAERSGLDNFDPTGRWYRPDPADDYHMSGAPTGIDKYRSQQTELHSALNAVVAKKKAEETKKKDQEAERRRRRNASKRTAKAASMAAEEKPWTYCDPPNQFQPPIIDNSPSRKFVKNSFLTGIWDGLEGMKSPHHEPNVKGVWDYSSNDSCKGLQGTFRAKPADRMGAAEQKHARILEQKLAEAQVKVGEDARRATVGHEKRNSILCNAEKFSTLRGAAKPWVLSRVMTHTVFSDEKPLVSKPGLDPYLDGDTRRQVEQTGRAHDHCRNIIGGNGQASKWNAPPARAVVGTQRRREQVDALINRRASSFFPAATPKGRRQVNFKDAEPKDRRDADRLEQESKPVAEESRQKLAAKVWDLVEASARGKLFETSKNSDVTREFATALAAEANCEVIDVGL
jgi:hypothetical protein